MVKSTQRDSIAFMTMTNLGMTLCTVVVNGEYGVPKVFQQPPHAGILVSTRHIFEWKTNVWEQSRSGKYDGVQGLVSCSHHFRNMSLLFFLRWSWHKPVLVQLPSGYCRATDRSAEPVRAKDRIYWVYIWCTLSKLGSYRESGKIPKYAGDTCQRQRQCQVTKFRSLILAQQFYFDEDHIIKGTGNCCFRCFRQTRQKILSHETCIPAEDTFCCLLHY